MLDLDWATIAFQIVNFLVLAAALYYLVFRPMMSRVRERRAEKNRLMEEAREDREEAERLRDELDERLSDAQARADEIVTKAQKHAEAERQEMLEEIEQQIERMLEDARDDVARMRQQAVDEFHDELIDTVLVVSTEMIGEAAPPEVQERLVKRLADRIWEMGQEEMERVQAFRQSLGDRTPTAHVTTAQPLSSEQQGELARTFAALADRNVDIEVETDPSLGSGLRVRIADMVIDNSIAGRLEELREQTSQAIAERLTGDE